MPSSLGACQSGKKDFCWFSVGIHTSILFKWPKWWHGQLFYLKSIEKAYRPVLSSLNIHRFIHTKRSLSDVTPTSPTLIASGLLASIYHCVNLFPFHIPLLPILLHALSFAPPLSSLKASSLLLDPACLLHGLLEYSIPFLLHGFSTFFFSIHTAKHERMLA